MKTAARPVHRTTPTADAKGGGRARKPFFHTVQSKTGEIQARSRFGKPGDKYEVEADRAADRVVDGKSDGTLASGISTLGQRKEKEEPQAKAIERPGRAGELVEEVTQPKMDDEAPADSALEQEPVQAKAEDKEPQAKAEKE